HAHGRHAQDRRQQLRPRADQRQARASRGRRQSHGPERRQDHRHHAFEDQPDRNCSGWPRWLYRAPRRPRPHRVDIRKTRESLKMKSHRPINRFLSAARWLAAACLVGTLFSLPAQAADPNKLQAIDVLTLPGQQLQLTMRLTGPAMEPLSFTIDNPARISFDLPNTELALPSRRIEVKSGGLDTILAAEAKDRTRLVLNLDRLVPYDTRLDGNNIVVTLGTPSAGGAAPARAAAAVGAAPVAAGPSVRAIRS